MYNFRKKRHNKDVVSLLKTLPSEDNYTREKKRKRMETNKKSNKKNAVVGENRNIHVNSNVNVNKNISIESKDDVHGSNNNEDHSPESTDKKYEFVQYHRCNYCNVQLKVESNAKIKRFNCPTCGKRNKIASRRTYESPYKEKEAKFQTIDKIDDVEIVDAFILPPQRKAPKRNKAKDVFDEAHTPANAIELKSKDFETRSSAPFYVSPNPTPSNALSPLTIQRRELDEVKRELKIHDDHTIYYTTGFKVRKFHLRHDCAKSCAERQETKESKLAKGLNETYVDEHDAIVTNTLSYAMLTPSLKLCDLCKRDSVKKVERQKLINEGKLKPHKKHVKLSEDIREEIRCYKTNDNMSIRKIQARIFDAHKLTVSVGTISNILHATEDKVMPSYRKGEWPNNCLYKDKEARAYVRNNLCGYIAQHTEINVDGGQDFSRETMKRSALIEWLWTNFQPYLKKKPSLTWMGRELKNLAIERLYIKYVKTKLIVSDVIQYEQCAYANWLVHHLVEVDHRNNIYIDYTRISPLKFKQDRVLTLPGYRPFRLNPLKNLVFEIGIATCCNGLLGWQKIEKDDKGKLGVKSAHWVDLVRNIMERLEAPDPDNNNQPYAYSITKEDQWQPMYIFMDNEKGEHQKKSGDWYESSGEFMDFLRNNGSVITPRMITQWYTDGKRWTEANPSPNFGRKFIFVFQSRYSPFFMPNEELHYSLTRRMSSVCYKIALDRLAESEEESVVGALTITSNDMANAIQTCLEALKRDQWKKYVQHVVDFAEALSDKHMNVRMLPNNLKQILKSVCKLPDGWKDDFNVPFLEKLDKDGDDFHYDSDNESV